MKESDNSMHRRSTVNTIATYGLLILVCGFAILPFYWLLRSSLMKLPQIFVLPPIWIPSPVQFDNYAEALTVLPFPRYFLNTSIIVVTAVIGVAITCSMAAYSFARLRWPYRDAVFAALLSSLMLPYAVTIVPTFIGWRILGGIDTYFPLIAPAWFGFGGGTAFYIFLLRQFYLTIPIDLDEAAYIDGASHLQVFTRVVLPLTIPALIVVTLFSFMFYWNDFLGPLIYLNSEAKYTLSVGLQLFQGRYNAQWHLMMAAATVVIAPAVIVFLVGQKYFVEGITLTGLKG